ncbi:MAG: GrpB family protein [Methanobacterium sp.]|uniref:GrpB family protein n=1 Tax=Methanobacterium sp. TaxID=2164 RepID=UPI003D650035|nr:GrpB family protein [Methanobacterium sp.]
MKVRLEEYDPEWKSLFEIEKIKLFKVINSKEIKIEHIGSTSIPDIYSKPVIDIMVGVKEEKQLDKYITKIISLGYTYMHKYEIYMPFRRYFFKLKDPEVQLPKIIGFNDEDIDKGNHEDKFHIHLVKINSDFWINQLLFRDYLRNNPKIKKEYENIKKSLAKKEWDSLNDYAMAKSEFITRVLEKAKK